MIRIAIIDDDKTYIEKINFLLNKYFPKDIEFEMLNFFDGKDFLLSSVNYDMVFMDIEMDQISGIDVIQEYKMNYPSTIVFFVTSHNNYIAEVFRLGSFQFLQKPINEKDFKIDINRAIKLYKDNHQRIEVKIKGSLIELNIIDIFHIEVYQKKIKLYTSDGIYEHSGNIEFYVKKLSGYGFAKTHKSYLINMRYIKRIEKDFITLNNLEKIPLSRNYKQKFLNEYNRFNMGQCI